MLNKLYIIIFFTILLTNTSNSNEINCENFKKFSVEYVKCKAGLVKNKTLSAGKKFVDDTKKYQSKEWSEQKEKIENVKKKVLD